jgi:hypothetical protein
MQLFRPNSDTNPRFPACPAALAGLLLVPLLLALAPTSAQAVPSFARQTGQNCVACHAGGQFPELTPYGRMFKLTGYTIGERALPLSMMGVVSASKVKDTTKSDDPPADFQKNRSLIFSSASLFVAGKVTENIGLFSQITYDNYAAPGVAPDGAGAQGFKGHTSADNIDLRFADRYIDSKRDLIYGLSVNNNPSVSDPWNTAAAWMQYVPNPSPSSSQFIDGNAPYPGFGSGGNIAGLNAYVYLNKTLYAELGGYQTANRSRSILSSGINDAGTTKLKGVNPYWRLALTREWGAHNIMVGTSGMYSKVYDGPDQSDPSTVHQNKDYGADVQYQYLLDPHTVTAQLAYMRSTVRYSDAVANQPAPFGFVDVNGNPLPNTNTSDTTNILRAKLSYIYNAKYGGSVGYFNRTGTTNTANQSSGYDPATNSIISNDPTGVATNLSTRVTGNLSGNPGTRGFSYEVFWMPVQLSAYRYIRVGLQYTNYSKFNGATTNYDGLGRDAKDNNSLFFYIWGAY